MNRTLMATATVIATIICAVAIIILSYSTNRVDQASPGSITVDTSINHAITLDNFKKKSDGNIDTYSIAINPYGTQTVAIGFPFYGPSFSIAVDGNNVASSGTFRQDNRVSWDKTSYTAPVAGTPLTVTVNIDTTDNRYFAATLNRELLVGNPDSINFNQDLGLVLEVAIICSLILFGVFQILLTTPSRPTGLWMGLYSISVSVLVLLWGDRDLISGLDYSWETFERIAIAIAFMSIVMFWQFAWSLTGSKWIKKTTDIIGPIMMAFSMVAIAVPVPEFTSTLFTYILTPALIISGTLKLYIFMKVYVENGGADIFNIIGYAFVTVTAAHDLLFLHGVIATHFFLHFGLFVFLGIRTAMEGAWFRETYRNKYSLAEDLSKANDELMARLNELTEYDNRLSSEKASRSRFLNLVFREIEEPLRDSRDMLDAANSFNLSGHLAKFIQLATSNVTNLNAQITSMLELQSEIFIHPGLRITETPKHLIHKRIEQLVGHKVRKSGSDSLSYNYSHTKNDELATFNTDLSKLMRPLDLFVENVVKHAAATQVSISTSFIEARGQNLMRLVIEDDGKGIPKNQLDAIQRMLQHGDLDTYYNSEPNQEVGHGLVMALQLIDEYGGRINMQSNGIQGLKVELLIPELPVSTDQPGESLLTKKILLVQAESDLKRSVHQLFKETGVEISLADTYENAIELSTREQYTLIIIDRIEDDATISGMIQKFKGVQGDETRNPATVVVATYKDPDIVHSQLEASGVDHVIGKPVGVNHLVQLLKAHEDVSKLISRGFG